MIEEIYVNEEIKESPQRNPQEFMVYLKGRTTKSVFRQQKRKQLYGMLCYNCNWRYSIHVSNTSDVPPGSSEACVIDNSSSPMPTVIQEEYKKTARYVWFYQQHFGDWDVKVPNLEICEVQIFGKFYEIILS